MPPPDPNLEKAKKLYGKIEALKWNHVIKDGGIWIDKVYELIAAALTAREKEAYADAAMLCRANLKSSTTQFLEHPGKRFFTYNCDLEEVIRAKAEGLKP